MKLFYHKDPVGNFGDDLNTWLWPRVAPGLLDNDEGTLFIGIGTILDNRIPDAPLKLVFGTGTGYGRMPALDERWRICCVRGPLTARALGLPQELAITDPAMLVRNVMPEERPGTYSISLMPHHRTKIRAGDENVDLETVVRDAGLHYIDPAAGAEVVLKSIAGSQLVIAEAMHGAIVADALRIPWMPVQLYDHISDLKWRDWCYSTGLDYSPAVLSPRPGEEKQRALSSFIRGTISLRRPMLSPDGAIAGKIRLLEEKLALIRQEHADACCLEGSAKMLPDPEVWRDIPWLYAMHSAIRELGEILPVGATYILVDQDEWGSGAILAGRDAIPFTERNGIYWGPPASDVVAINELERLRAAGAAYLVFAYPSFWWLDFYSHFSQHLRSTYPVMKQSHYLIAFDLG
ncbi:MAG TPA: hypothetical protein VJ183_10865 [Chloroflexia bacterium]|nr:hypothetical protein [Chloroflexia bacterium]